MNLDEQKALLKRVKMCLEDGEWEKVEELTEMLLNHDPEMSEAYLYKFLSSRNVMSLADAAEDLTPLRGDNNLERALKFADDKLRAEINKQIKHNELNIAYADAYENFNKAQTEEACDECYKAFKQLGEFKDAKAMLDKCLDKKAEIAEKKAITDQRKAKLEILLKKAGKIAGAILAVYLVYLALMSIFMPMYYRSALKDKVSDIFSKPAKRISAVEQNRESILVAAKGAIDLNDFGAVYEYTGTVSSKEPWHGREHGVSNGTAFFSNYDNHPVIQVYMKSSDPVSLSEDLNTISKTTCTFYVDTLNVDEVRALNSLKTGDTITVRGSRETVIHPEAHQTMGKDPITGKYSPFIVNKWITANIEYQYKYCRLLSVNGSTMAIPDNKAISSTSPSSQNNIVNPRPAQVTPVTPKVPENKPVISNSGNNTTNYSPLPVKAILSKLKGTWDGGRAMVYITDNSINNVKITSLKGAGSPSRGVAELNPTFVYNNGHRKFNIKYIEWLNPTTLKIYLDGTPETNGYSETLKKVSGK